MQEHLTDIRNRSPLTFAPRVLLLLTQNPATQQCKN